MGHNKKPVFAHKYILAARCDVFKAMFTDRAGGAGGADKLALPGGRESAGTLPAGLGSSLRSDDAPIVIEKLTPDVFLAMLEFIYSNCVTLNSRIVCSLFRTFKILRTLIIHSTRSCERRPCRFSAARTSTASRNSRRCSLSLIKAEWLIAAFHAKQPV